MNPLNEQKYFLDQKIYDMMTEEERKNRITDCSRLFIDMTKQWMAVGERGKAKRYFRINEIIDETNKNQDVS